MSDNIQPVIDGIEELSKSAPKGWKKMVAERINKSHSLVDKVSKGERRKEETVFLVFDNLQQVVNEYNLNIKKRTAS